MRAIIHGLTDAAFERLYGTEASCLAVNRPGFAGGSNP
jgi:hypothetical protein